MPSVQECPVLTNGFLGLEGRLISKADPVAVGRGGGGCSGIGATATASTNSAVMGQDGAIRAKSIQNGVELGRIGVTVNDCPRCVGVGIIWGKMRSRCERSFMNG